MPKKMPPIIETNIFIWIRINKNIFFTNNEIFAKKIVSFHHYYIIGNFVAKQNVLCRKLNTTYT